MKLAAVFLVLVLGITSPLVACSPGAESPGTTDSVDSSSSGTDAQFETDNPDDSTFTDDAGNEMQVGENLVLPPEWPALVPTPEGSLIAVSIVDSETAVATWQTPGDVFVAEQSLVELFESGGFEVTKSVDLSTDANTVYTAVGNGLDVTISATSGEVQSDPGEITVLVNPGM